jgi:hypothetical protein
MPEVAIVTLLIAFPLLGAMRAAGQFCCSRSLVGRSSIWA